VSILPRTVISNCTTRKAAGPSISLADVSRAGGVLATARRWKTLVKRSPATHTAAHLYKGRSIVDATTAADAMEGTLFVVSAGLGLVAADDHVPNYDLTVVTGSPLARMLNDDGLGPEDWWAALHEERRAPLSDLVATTMAFLALPASYLRLVRHDLALVPAAASKRLRIFTSEAGRTAVPQRLLSCVMPYDDRLETVQGFNGTRAEFPQRALRHFVEQLRGHELSLADGRQAVLESLASQERRIVPARTRASDDEIRALLAARWHACNGSSVRLLRYLRDDAKVSCEQGRFRGLWRSLVPEMRAVR
jgi:hypothetical protein